MTNTWPRRASSPRTVGTPGSASTTSVTALRSANRRRRSTEPSAKDAEVDVVAEHELAAALDPREIEQLADHLDEMPGLDLDLEDPLPHPRRHVGALRVAGERLGEEADGAERRAELVAEVVDELRPDLLESAQLGDVLEHHEAAVVVRSVDADDEDAGLAVPDLDLAAGRAARRHPVDQALRARGRGRPP